jgi:hypothetical protein
MNGRIRRTDRIVALALVVLLGSLGGCFSARDQRPLKPGGPVVSRVPILPVLASQVRITVSSAEGSSTDGFSLAESPRESKEPVAELVNEILDTLTREHSSLIGPSRLLLSLSEADHERLYVYLDDPGPIDEAWKIRGLKEIGLALDVDRLVRVRVQLLLEEDTLTDVADVTQSSWRGQAKVSAELLALSPVAALARGEGQDRLWGDVGVAGAGGYGAAIVVPYALGRGLGKSLDTAARQALAELLTAMGEAP